MHPPSEGRVPRVLVVFTQSKAQAPTTQLITRQCLPWHLSFMLHPIMHPLCSFASLALFLTLATPAAAASEPTWWKGNLHTHTLWSDGDGFPEMVTDWYYSHGYHFLALSDHNVLNMGERWMDLARVAARAQNTSTNEHLPKPRTAFADYLQRFGPHWVETRPNPTNGQTQVRLKPLDECRTLFERPGRFLMIPAEEITHQALNGRAIHIGAVNILETIMPRDGATVRETIQNNLRAVLDSAARTRQQVLIHVNHPNYKWGVTAEDLAAIVDEPFFEVWNGVQGDNDPGDDRHPSTDEMWDIANTLRLAQFQASPLYGLANDDSHDYQGSKTRALPGRAWIMVRARFLTPESIIQAMRRGDFYASTGVMLDDVQRDAAAGQIRLRIHPQRGETFVTRFIGTRRGVSLAGRPRLDADGHLLEATLDYRTSTGPQIGEVLKEERGLHPHYAMRGDELYVRAVVTSSGRPTVPSTEYPCKRAWVQPVLGPEIHPAR